MNKTTSTARTAKYRNRKSRLTTFGLLNRANHGKRHVVIASIIGQNDCTEKNSNETERIDQKQTVSIVFHSSFRFFPRFVHNGQIADNHLWSQTHTLDFFLLRSSLSLSLSLTYQWIWARTRLEYGRKKVLLLLLLLLLLLFAAAV